MYTIKFENDKPVRMTVVSNPIRKETPDNQYNKEHYFYTVTMQGMPCELMATPYLQRSLDGHNIEIGSQISIEARSKKPSSINWIVEVYGKDESVVEYEPPKPRTQSESIDMMVRTFAHVKEKMDIIYEESEYDVPDEIISSMTISLYIDFTKNNIGD